MRIRRDHDGSGSSKDGAAGSMSRTRWLMVREVAEQLRVSRDTVERWIHKGQLQAIDVSPNGSRGNHRSCWRISTEDLEEFVRSRCRKKRPPGRRKPRRRRPDVIEFIR